MWYWVIALGIVCGMVCFIAAVASSPVGGLFGPDWGQLAVVVVGGGVVIGGGYILCVYAIPGLFRLMAGIPAFAFIQITELVVVLAIFGIGCWLVYKLWQLVIDAISDMKQPSAKALVQMVGGLDIEGQRKDGSSFRITGIGLLGTLVIIICCVLVIYIILSARTVAAPAQPAATLVASTFSHATRTTG